MDVSLNLALAAGMLVFAVFCGWRGMRPADPHRGVRLVPWRPLMALSFAACLLLLWILVQTHKG
jgi:hypothetical protein